MLLNHITSAFIIIFFLFFRKVLTWNRGLTFIPGDAFARTSIVRLYLAECRRILESGFNQDDTKLVDKLLSNAKEEYGIIYKQKEYTYARHLSIEMDLFIGFYHKCSSRMYVYVVLSFLDL